MLTERAQFDCRCFLEVKVMAAKLQTKEAGMKTLECGTASFCYTLLHTHTHYCQHTEAKGNMQEMLL